jgi:ElaB/YqjD/DUF883 family membrane-anchored ribosome-binding protein
MGPSRLYAIPEATLELSGAGTLPLKQHCLPQAAAMAAMEAGMAQARAGSDGERHANEDFESLRFDMEALRKDFGTLISTLKSDVSGRTEAERAQEQVAREDFDSLRSGMDALRKDFGTLVGALKSNMSSRADDLQTMGRQQLRSVEGKVEARPLLSLGIIFAMALVLGRLLYRR